MTDSSVLRYGTVTLGQWFPALHRIMSLSSSGTSSLIGL